MYNNTQYAETIRDHLVHIRTRCFGIDIEGIIENYDIYKGEIIYTIKAGTGRLHVGANTPGLIIEILS